MVSDIEQNNGKIKILKSVHFMKWIRADKPCQRYAPMQWKKKTAKTHPNRIFL